MKHPLLIFFLLLATLPVRSQPEFSHQLYTSNDGLSASQCIRVFQDSRDFLWIGTAAGLNRFDGRRFIYYTPNEGLFGALVQAITEDPKGNIWVGTPAGLFRYNGIRFQKVREFGEIRDLIWYGGQIWVASRQGLFSWDGRKVTTYTEKQGLLSGNVTCLQVTSDNKLLVGTSKGINRYDGRFSVYWKEEQDSYIRNIAEDHSRRVWIATLEGNIYLRNGNGTGVIYSDTSHADMPRNIIVNAANEVLVLRQNSYNIFRNGTYAGDWGGIYADYDEGFMHSIQDREGNYWIATNFGLICLRPSQLTKFKGIKSVNGLFTRRADSLVYVSDGRYIYAVSGDSLINLYPDKPFQYSAIEQFARLSNGTTLFGTRLAGLMRYRRGKYDMLYENQVWAAHTTDSTAYISTEEYIIAYRGDSAQFYPNKIHTDGRAIRALTIFQEPSGTVLAGTQRGLHIWDNGKYTPCRVPIKDERLVITDIQAYNDNTLLLGTKGYGLLHARRRGTEVQILTILNNRKDLSSNYIHNIQVSGNLIFLSTMNGIYKLTPPLSDPKIEYISTYEGMPHNSWSEGPLAADKKGFIYVGGSKGLVRFHRDSSFTSRTRQNTYITGVDVNNAHFNWQTGDSNLSFTGIPASYTFRHFQNTLTFRYTGINFYKPARIRYQYVLKARKADTVTGTTDFVVYNNLPPGDYTFLVRSTTNQQFTSEPFTSFRFRIKAPFWQTYWFRVAAVLLLLAAVYTYYRWRLQLAARKQHQELMTARQLNESKILAFQARMNPHFIFNSLNAIQYFILNNEKHETLTYLSKFGKLLRQILDNSMESKINLEKEIAMLQSYVEMEELRFDHKFRFSISIAPDLVPGAIDIPGMVIQPFVENAILHGLLHKESGGMLKIDFSKQGAQVICTVEDNGIGREESARLNAAKATSHQSHGTRIAINRLELLNDPEQGVFNTVEFIDLYEHGVASGTRVVIKMPIL